MEVEFACECGQMMRAEIAPEGGTVRCPACGQMLTVRAPSPTATPPAQRERPARKAVVAMVLGLCGLLPAIGLLTAPIGIGLGIAVLVRKLRGRGYGIAGIATGAFGLVVVQTFTAGVVFMVVTVVRQVGAMVTSIAPATMPTMVTPANLDDREIREALTLHFGRAPHPQAGKAELAKAREFYARRDADPGNAYRALENFAWHLALKGGGGFDAPEDARAVETLRSELSASVREKLDKAGRFQTNGRWKQAAGAYAEVMQLVPDRTNVLHTTAAVQRESCRALAGDSDEVETRVEVAP